MVNRLFSLENNILLKRILCFILDYWHSLLNFRILLQVRTSVSRLDSRTLNRFYWRSLWFSILFVHYCWDLFWNILWRIEYFLLSNWNNSSFWNNRWRWRYLFNVLNLHCSFLVDNNLLLYFSIIVCPRNLIINNWVRNNIKLFLRKKIFLFDKWFLCFLSIIQYPTGYFILHHS